MEAYNKILDWVDNRTGLITLTKKFLYEPVPEEIGWLFTLGSACAFLFILQVITGIFLAIYYVPSADHAYESIQFITNELIFGKIVRGIHHWAASFFVVFIVLHMLRVFFYGSYKSPRETNWITGVFLLLIVLGFGFTGYLLPWDQKAFWATKVGTEIARLMPLVGDFISQVIKGGSELGALTLTRFYAIHTLILPAVIMLLIITHLYLMRKHGISGSFKSNNLNGKAEKTKPFYPDHAIKDVAVSMAIFIAIFIIAIFINVPTDRPADPTDNTYIPRPDWYFLFLFELLKYFKGSSEIIGAIVIPNLAIILLLLLPFFDTREERNPLKRPVASLAGICAVIVVSGLTFRAYMATPAQPYIEARLGKEMIDSGKRMLPIELAGKVIFKEQNCLRCHSLKGVGGNVGPDLTLVARKRDAEWTLKHFQDPESIAPGLRMPPVRLSDKYLDALAAYLLRLSSPSSKAFENAQILEKGGKLFYDNNCYMCHTIDGVGGRMAPDLTHVASRRDEKWIIAHLKNPKAFTPDSIMPSFAKLGEEKLKTLTKFLLTYK